jgi:hypothetical protein
VRLEPLCRISMRYTEGSWHRPYGTEGTSVEGLGFGQGDGIVSGGLEGKVVWANYPRRREDGVWTPNLRGVITTNDGGELLISIHGQSVEEQTPGHRRAILARVELTTQEDQYRWLNTCFIIGEGEIDEEREDAWLEISVCVNEVANGPPALGAQPPERFRQPGVAQG